MLDFSKCEVIKTRLYNGSNGRKICIKYDNQNYMLKFPTHIKGKTEYASNVISEYIGSHIFSMVGLKSQETILGNYHDKKDYLVVACKDFCNDNKRFYDFASLKNTIRTTSLNGYGTSLELVIDAIKNQNLYNNDKLEEFFWDMFIVDSFIGNFDRHNGNWGFLIDVNNNVSLAPIFDCASSLYPELNDNDIKSILKNPQELDKRVYVFPNSALKLNIKISPYFFINSLAYDGCNSALLRIFPKIDIGKIEDFIKNIDCISNIRKEFLIIILKKRYTEILKPAYLTLLNNLT